MRFLIFCRDRDRKQRAQGEQSSGEGAMDLVSCARAEYRKFTPGFAPTSILPCSTPASPHCHCNAAVGVSVLLFPPSNPCPTHPSPLPKHNTKHNNEHNTDVEFQRSFAQLLKSHRAALRSNRRFWRLLVRSEVAFRHLSEAFVSMDSTELRADRAYRSILERYPKSVKLKRAFL